MNTIYNNADTTKQSKEILKSLQKAVANALIKKQKLGQYAVIWDGKKPINKKEFTL